MLYLSLNAHLASLCFLSYLGLHLGYTMFLMNLSHFYLLYGKSFANHFDSSVKDKKGKDEKARSEGDKEKESECVFWALELSSPDQNPTSF